MKTASIITVLTILLCCGAAAAQSYHPLEPLLFFTDAAFSATTYPLDPPVINFQGRIEVGDLGYSGVSWFAFSIGNEGFTDIYWQSWAATTCTEGIYNILLGKDTDEILDQDAFRQDTDIYLRVAFARDSDDDGTVDSDTWEILSPDQQITGVAFAVNANLLDGLDSPDSNIVGVNDTQTLTNKSLTAPVLTRPMIDSTYFVLEPGTLPSNPSTGYIGFDSTSNAVKYFNGTQWVDWGQGTGGNVPVPGTNGNILRDSGSAWQSTNQLQVWDYGSYQGCVDIQGVLSFNNHTEHFIRTRDVGSYAYFEVFMNDQTQVEIRQDGRFTLFTSGTLSSPLIRVKDPNGNWSGFAWQTEGDQINIITNQLLRLSIGGEDAPGGGYVKIPLAGSAADPALKIGSENSNFAGLFRPAANELAIASYGTERVRFHDDGEITFTAQTVTKASQTGYVGIGTSSPTSLLSIRKDNNEAPLSIHYSSTNDTDYTGMRLKVHNTVGDDRYKGAMFFQRTGGNGIGNLLFALDDGTTADANALPADAKMIVKSTGQVNLVPVSSVSGAAAGDMYFDDDDDKLKYYDGTAWVVLTAPSIVGPGGELPEGTADGQTLRWEADDSEWQAQSALVIDDDGNVGIGSRYDPIYLLEVGAVDYLSVDTEGDLRFIDTDGSSNIFGPEGGPLVFRAANGQYFEFHVGADYQGRLLDQVFKLGNAADDVYLSLSRTDDWPAIIGHTDAHSRWFLGANDTFDENALTIASQTDVPIIIAANNQERVRILPGDSGTWVEITSSMNDQSYGVVYISASGTSSNALYIDKPGGNYAGVNINLQSDASGAGVRISNDGSGRSIDIQHRSDTQKGIWIHNYGNKGALWIQQSGDIANASVDNNTGGSLHVYNSYGLGSAITAYSSETSVAPLAWFRASYQPVLRLQGKTGGANPLHLVPQANPAAGDYAVQTGEIYVNTDGTLRYYNGTSWTTLTGSGGGAEDFATRALDNLSGVAINADLIPEADNTLDLGSAGASWADLFIDGTATLATVDINAGAIDGTAIGQDSAGLGAFTNLTADTVADASLATPGRVVIAGDGGDLTDDAELTYDAALDRLTATHGTFTSLTTVTITTDAVGTAVIDEFSTDGTLAGNSDSALPTEQAVKTYVASAFTAASGVGGSGTADQVAYWTSATQIGGDDDLTFDGSLLTASWVRVTSSMNDQSYGVVYISASGTSSNALYIDKPAGNYAGVNINLQSDASGAGIRITNEGSGRSIDIQHKSDTQKAIWINNQGNKGALWIQQSGDLANTAVNDSDGGSIHVWNYRNQGSAITAYSTQTAVSSLVWFRASYQPVLKLQAESNESDPLLLVPQVKPAGGRANYAIQTGEIYMDTDGSLNYYSGQAWEQMFGRWSTETISTRESTSEFTVSAQRSFIVGRPLRYRGTVGSGAWRYGMVTAYSGGTVTIAGASLSDPIAEIQVGKPELLRQVNIYEPWYHAVNDDFTTPNSWEMQDSYVVRATAKLEVAAEGDDAHIGFGIGQTDDDLLSGVGYLTLADGDDTKQASVVEIDTGNYAIVFGDKLFVKVLQIGTDVKGSDLSVTMEVVTP